MACDRPFPVCFVTSFVGIVAICGNVHRGRNAAGASSNADACLVYHDISIIDF